MMLNFELRSLNFMLPYGIGILQPFPLEHRSSCFLFLYISGNMVDISHSPTPNGYHRASPCSSPGMMVNKGMARQSPPIHSRQPGNHPGPPRIMVPDNRNNMMNSEVIPYSVKKKSKNVFYPCASIILSTQ